MANLEELQSRIKTVKSTQKITAAMKMVAAAKLRRVQHQLMQVRQSARITEKMLNHLIAQPWDDPVIYCRRDQGSNHIVIVMGGDKGLCGSYNVNILKEARRCLTKLQTEGELYQLIPFGKKIYEGLKHFSNAQTITFDPTPKALANQLMTQFHEGKIQTVRVISTRFRNVLMQQVKTTFLLPFEAEPFYQNDCPSFILTEPTDVKFLPRLFEQNLELTLHRLIFESSVCEHAARMTAMNTATQNASEVINKLNLLYNQSRQAKITSELIEIISGAQAV